MKRLALYVLAVGLLLAWCGESQAQFFNKGRGTQINIGNNGGIGGGAAFFPARGAFFRQRAFVPRARFFAAPVAAYPVHAYPVVQAAPVIQQQMIYQQPVVQQQLLTTTTYQQSFAAVPAMDACVTPGAAFTPAYGFGGAAFFPGGHHHHHGTVPGKLFR